MLAMFPVHLKMRSAVLVVVTLTSLVSTSSLPGGSESGQHCGMVVAQNYTGTNYNGTEVYRCVQCLFPQNCLANNTCRLGTFGQTCEKCLRGGIDQQGYYRLGNTCAKCQNIPYSSVSFGMFLLFAIIATVINGFSESVCTKLKLISHFVQYLLLSFHIKIPWPEMLVLIMSALNFGCFNSNIITPGCLFPRMRPADVHYMEWISSLAIVTIVFIIGKLIDNFMVGGDEKRDWGSSAMTRLLGKHKRTTLRRFVFFILVIMYLPVTITGLHTYLCSDSVPVELVLDHSKDIYLLDNDLPCGAFMFQTISFVATIFLVVYVFFFPILLVFLTLRQKKWDLLYAQWTLYGPAYESYKDYFCFGEAIHLLRKLVSVVVNDAYPIQPMVQVGTQLGMSGFYLLLLIVLRPYRRFYWGKGAVNIHVTFELLSTAAICLVQVVALLIVQDQFDPILEYVTIGAVGVVIVVWVLLLLATPAENCDLEILDEIVDEGTDGSKKEKKVQRKQRNILTFWKKKKVGPDPEFVEKVAERQQHVDF